MSLPHILGFCTCASGRHYGICPDCGVGHGWILSFGQRMADPHLYQCSVCRAIRETDEQSLTFGSRALHEEFPRECVYACSEKCIFIARRRLETGTWNLPVLRPAFAGSGHDIARPGRGYAAQPLQSALVRQLLSTAYQTRLVCTDDETQQAVLDRLRPSSLPPAASPDRCHSKDHDSEMLATGLWCHECKMWMAD
jgi:hypothetical protein